uniref:Putative phage infection protein n=1 Tax=Methanococcus maripaludis (strain C6 / ATCC BAA-1332) TaxID=444158 RepID=A9AB22_METM6
MEVFDSSIERFEKLKENQQTINDTENIIEENFEDSNLCENEEFENFKDVETDFQEFKSVDSDNDDFESLAHNLKNSMNNIFNKIKLAMDKPAIPIKKIETGSEGNNNLLESINNKLDILIASNNEQTSKLDVITSEIDNVLSTIDNNSEKIIDALDAQNVKISGLLNLLQEIYEGVQDIKYILKDFTPENIDQASGVVDNLKYKIDNYMDDISEKAEA